MLTQHDSSKTKELQHITILYRSDEKNLVGQKTALLGRMIYEGDFNTK